jgi:hypothetical protein
MQLELMPAAAAPLRRSDCDGPCPQRSVMPLGEAVLRSCSEPEPHDHLQRRHGWGSKQDDMQSEDLPHRTAALRLETPRRR